MMVAIALVFIGRLAQLQVGSDYWSDYAERLTEEREIRPPARGMIYDRNGKLLVTNLAGYALTVTPREAHDMDTLKLANLLNWEKERLVEALDKARAYASYKSSVIARDLDGPIYARLTGELWRFSGVETRVRPVRSNVAGVAAHLIGAYRETTRDDLNQDSFYRLGDYIGKSGIEARFESNLRGQKGVSYHLVDVRNDIQAMVSEGSLDTAAVPGKDITLTLDLDLQAFAEELMQGKKGSVVAIEPATGEVLALVSAPTYDTDLLTGPGRALHYDSISHHPWKPLYNRSLRGTYRPGSIFKMLQGLIALEEGVITKNTRIPCNRDIINCHGEHSFDDLSNAVVHSCNPYFHETMRRMIEGRRATNFFDDAALGLGQWTQNVKRFGFGTNLGGQLPGGRSGLVPDTTYYDRVYGERRWAYSTIYSISIGEGELLATPLHMANMAAILANRGWYRTPHAVRDIGGQGKPMGSDSLIETGVAVRHFKPIISAMEQVISAPTGTGWRARIPGISVCGKTGTVQDDPRLEHSVFMAFAPKDNPTIALSVYVENAGSGGRWAAPIASLLIEQYLTDSIADTDRLQAIRNATYPFPED